MKKNENITHFLVLICCEREQIEEKGNLSFYINFDPK